MQHAAVAAVLHRRKDGSGRHVHLALRSLARMPMRQRCRRCATALRDSTLLHAEQVTLARSQNSLGAGVARSRLRARRVVRAVAVGRAVVIIAVARAVIHVLHGERMRAGEHRRAQLQCCTACCAAAPCSRPAARARRLQLSNVNA